MWSGLAYVVIATPPQVTRGDSVDRAWQSGDGVPLQPYGIFPAMIEPKSPLEQVFQTRRTEKADFAVTTGSMNLSSCP